VQRFYEAIESVREQLAAEAKAFVTPGRRMVDEIECVFSVLLAIVLGHLVGAQNISWAAFSGFMVMRGHVSESLRRGILRIIGTAGGAALAVAIFAIVAATPFALSLALALIGGCSLYGALTHRHAYGFLFIGLTFLDGCSRIPALMGRSFGFRRVKTIGSRCRHHGLRPRQHGLDADVAAEVARRIATKPGDRRLASARRTARGSRRVGHGLAASGP
jgi:hypothetical protein